MKKRTLALTLIGALLLSSMPLAAAAAEETTTLPYSDVAESRWSYDAIAFAYEKGIMTGMTETTFEPTFATSRAMIVSILYRLEGSPDLSGENLGYPYADAPGDSWYGAPVYWARANGIVSGYSAERFGPNDPVTREQLAAILYNYAEWKGMDVSARADLSLYSDAGMIHSWATEVVSWAHAEGLLQGVSHTTLNPLDNASREQVAAIFQRFLAEGTQDVTLSIGRPDSLTEVTATIEEDSADAVIAALAAETGWDLTLARPVWSSGDNFAVVAFAEDSGIYGEPPEPQKPEYHVYDVEDWLFTVFNSVTETLKNYGYNGAAFTAPDGSDIVIDRDGYHFYLSSDFVWDYHIAWATNHPEAQALDAFTSYYGSQSPDEYGLNLIFPVDGVEPNTGSITFTDRLSDTVLTFDVKSDVKDVTEAYSYHARAQNFEHYTVLRIELPAELRGNTSFIIHIDADAFRAPDGSLTTERTLNA